MDDRARGALESLVGLGMVINGFSIVLLALQAFWAVVPLSGVAAAIGLWAICCEVHDG
ncbi:hypothetical protein [Pantanalinema sp. GBBB05]|uniref:hypothetical protein n=1 Tax=Pantanalinema sp. GBBB05 TaxID=2604139 RepID=UPI003D81BD25